ncbi:hypothetical protein AN219_22795 [Streptomyces nanshensis]|nr:hypothetical protein AN219_22795 [Streptomyces nanshensis]
MVTTGDREPGGPGSCCPRPQHQLTGGVWIRRTVPVAVEQHHALAPQLRHRFPRRAPGGQPDHRPDHRVAGCPKRRPATHGMPDQHDGHRPHARCEFVQCPACVHYWVRTRAVPAAMTVAHSTYQHLGVACRPEHGPGERAHAEGGQVPPWRRVQPVGATAVQQQYSSMR